MSPGLDTCMYISRAVAHMLRRSHAVSGAVCCKDLLQLCSAKHLPLPGLFGKLVVSKDHKHHGCVLLLACMLVACLLSWSLIVRITV